MKHSEREPYLILADWLTAKWATALCSFCKYAEIVGCDENPVCRHPLEWRLPAAYSHMEPGDDCWGFRPAYSREDCVDMAGIWIQGQAVDLNTIASKRCI